MKQTEYEKNINKKYQRNVRIFAGLILLVAVVAAVVLGSR